MEDEINTSLLESPIYRLIDDGSPVVRKALEEELNRMGSEGRRLLEAILEKGEQDKREAAKAFLSNFGSDKEIAQFHKFIESMNYDLETGMSLIHQIAHPGDSQVEIKVRIDEIALRCEQLLVPPQRPQEVCQVINRVLFHEYGFRGNTEDYENPSNSFIGEVLLSKKGIPVSLSILYVLIAERLNFSLECIALPGHFVVGCFHSLDPFFIDPFERGRMRSVDEMKQFMLRRNIVPDLRYLVPAPIASVLLRVCRNLSLHYKLSENLEMRKSFEGFVHAFEMIHHQVNDRNDHDG